MSKADASKTSQNQIKALIAKAQKSTYFKQGVIVAVLICFILFIFLPLWMSNRKTSAQLKELERRIQTAGQKIARIPEMKKQKEEYTKDLAVMKEQFFDSNEMDKLIEIISKSASEAGVRITATRPTDKSLAIPAPFDQFYMTTGYELTVEGPYHNFGAFINGIERYPKRFVITSLEIKKGEKDQDVPQYSLLLAAFLKKG